MFCSGTVEHNKEVIMKSMIIADGTVRVVFAIVLNLSRTCTEGWLAAGLIL